MNSRNETVRLLKSRLAAETAPDRRDRVELAAIGFHWPNASLSHRMDHDLGYNPVRLKLFTDATGAGDHVALASQRQFSRLAPSYSSPLYQLMGLRFIAAGVPISDIGPALRGKEPPLIGRGNRENREPPAMLALGAQDLGVFDPSSDCNQSLSQKPAFLKTAEMRRSA